MVAFYYVNDRVYVHPMSFKLLKLVNDNFATYFDMSLSQELARRVIYRMRERAMAYVMEETSCH